VTTGAIRVAVDEAAGGPHGRDLHDRTRTPSVQPLDCGAMERRSVGRELVAPFALYLALAVVLTAEVWAAPTSRWIGICCDPEQTIWFLRWIPYAVSHLTDPFVTQQLNAPTGVNLMWNASIPFLSLVMAPVSLTAGPIAAYNVAVVLSIAVSAGCAFVVLRRWTASPVGAFVGGAVYGFSPYLASHAAIHLNLIATWAPPLYLLLLDELLIRRRRSPLLIGVCLGLLSASQLLTAEELLATSVVSAGVFVAVLLAVLAMRHRDEVVVGARRTVAAVLAATLTFLLVAGWPLAVQLFGPLRIVGSVQDVERFSSDLLNLILPTPYQLIAPDAATRLSTGFSGLYHEATAYLGLPLVVLLGAIVARRWADVRVRIAGLMAALMFLLSLGPTLHIAGMSTGVPLPWWPLSKLPLLEHALPGRLTLFMYLAVGAIVALAVDGSIRRPVSAAVPRLVAIGLAVALCLPAPLRSSTVDVPPFFGHWSEQGIGSDEIILFAPFFRNGAGADPMVWAAVAGDEPRMYEAYAYVPLADGSPSFGPARTELSSAMEAIQDRGVTLVARGGVRDQIARDFEAASISVVIVGPMRNRPQMVGFLTDLLGRPPREVEGVQLWTDVDSSGVVPAA